MGSIKKFIKENKAFSYISITITILILIGMGANPDKADAGNFFKYLILVAVIYFLINFKKDKNKICAWCGSKDVSFQSGEEGEWTHRYTNTDGSADLRYKDNPATASFSSLALCKQCNALTKFEHYEDEVPNFKRKVWKRTLENKGSGERLSSDWESV